MAVVAEEDILVLQEQLESVVMVVVAPVELQAIMMLQELLIPEVVVVVLLGQVLDGDIMEVVAAQE